jgi:uncharacterized membrane protein YoaK (UPF0700 family)
MTAPPDEPRAAGPWPAPLLSFVGGFVDTFSYVTLFGLFTAHVTGNFVTIGAALAGHGPAGLVGKLLALPVFVAGVAGARWLQRRGPADRPRELVMLQLCGLVAFMGCGLLAGAPSDANAAAAVLPGLVGVAAMAVQNTLARSSLARLGQTTVMTGNVTQATMDLVDLLRGDGAGDAEGATARRIAALWPPIAAFAAGAIAAGLLIRPAGDWALLLPIGALLLVWRQLRD